MIAVKIIFARCLRIWTMNVARHTFATSGSLSIGDPIETVSKMLGHNLLKITQSYARIVDSKISGYMKKLMSKFEINIIGAGGNQNDD